MSNKNEKNLVSVYDCSSEEVDHYVLTDDEILFVLHGLDSDFYVKMAEKQGFASDRISKLLRTQTGRLDILTELFTLSFRSSEKIKKIFDLKITHKIM